ncbi:MAG: DUF1775 domain-containing protein [Actinomycetota bacterium]
MTRFVAGKMLPVPANLIPRRRAGAVIAAVVLVTLVVAFVTVTGVAQARADMGIPAGAVAPGDVVTFAFQVVNDRAPAATTRIQLDFPRRPAIAYADAVPVPGWTFQVQKYRLAHAIDTPEGTSGLAISRLVWTGGPLSGAQLVRFVVRIGPVSSATTRIVFRSEQTYDSGVTVRWADKPDSSTPRRPSPVLAVSRYAAARGPGAAVAPDSPFNLSEKKAIDRRVRVLIRNGEVATPDDLASARWLALVALIVSAAGLAFGIAAFSATRRRSSRATDRAGATGASAATDAPPRGEEAPDGTDATRASSPGA